VEDPPSSWRADEQGRGQTSEPAPDAVVYLGCAALGLAHEGAASTTHPPTLTNRHTRTHPQANRHVPHTNTLTHRTHTQGPRR
jgi:hypothetical protein